MWICSDNSKFKVMLKNDDTLHYLKQEVEKKIHIPPRHQIYHTEFGRLIEGDNTTLGDFKNEMVLVMTTQSVDEQADVEMEVNEQEAGSRETQQPEQYYIGSPEHHPLQLPEHHPLRFPEHHPVQPPEHHPEQLPEHHPGQLPEHHPLQLPEHHLVQLPEHHPVQLPEHHPVQLPEHHPSAVQSIDIFASVGKEEGSNIVIYTKEGNIDKIDRTEFEAQGDPNNFATVTAFLEERKGVQDVRYSQWVLVKFKDTVAMDRVYEYFARGDNLVLVTCVCPDMCAAVCRRSKLRTKMSEPPVPYEAVYVIKTNSNDTQAKAVSVCRALCASGQRVITNFSIRRVDMNNYTWRDLENEWAPLSTKEKQAECLDAEEKVRLGRQLHARDEYISKMGRQVLRDSATSSSVPPCVFFAENHDIMTISEFENLEGVTCRSFDVITGEVVEFSLTEWITKKHYLEYTLVLHGDANLGKTQVAKCFLSMLATEMAETSDKPYFVKVETIEADLFKSPSKPKSNATSKKNPIKTQDKRKTQGR
eukprot:6466106-Amphidinium_carterae.1